MEHKIRVSAGFGAGPTHDIFGGLSVEADDRPRMQGRPNEGVVDRKDCFSRQEMRVQGAPSYPQKLITGVEKPFQMSGGRLGWPNQEIYREDRE